ncbi:MAG TPA: phosphatase PAP2 family protein [Gaiellales bacterium]|nr:phosphatase PAP2 family protein [Gaiellales bacterium]
MRVALRHRLSSLLPRGPLDLVRQIAIVSLFDIAYELSRVVATGDRRAALAHAHSVVDTERSLGIFRELSVQRFALHAPGVVLDVANWTYFNAQYAAMPRLHTAYALIFGVSGVVLARRWWIRGMWALYPGLVVFSIIATANHFVLDAVAGAAVAVLAGTVTTVVVPRVTRTGRSRTAPALRPDRACA